MSDRKPENYKILLVDDEPSMLEIIGKALQSAGYLVMTAESGEKAFELLYKTTFDLVITDLIMHPVDGIEVLRRVRQLSSETRVIIFTAYGHVDSAIDALRLDADDFILKPCAIRELYFRVDRCLDVLDLKRKVRKAHDDLERKVADRTAELTKANQLLKDEIEERKRIEEVQRIYEMIISTVQDPMSFIDRDYIYQTVNDEYLKLHKKPRAEIVGHSVEELLGAEVFRHIREYLDRCLSGEKVHYQSWFHYPDETPKYMDVTYYPFFEQDKSVSGMVVSSRDITEMIQTKEALQKQSDDLRERVKELNCLYDISRLVVRHEISSDDIFQEMVNRTPSACRYPEIACAKLIINGGTFKTEGYKKTRWKLQHDILVSARPVGVLTVCYVEKRPEWGEYPFLKEEKTLLIAIAKTVDLYLEHRLADKKLLIYQEQLRSLSSELLLTEERERRRIATDLHDRIGQTLAITKIRLGGLRELAAPCGFAEELDTIRGLIEQTIQDTRSLTFEISPPVLYDLGLEAATEWLIEELQKKHDIRIVFECDHSSRITDSAFRVLLFRAMRELLFNMIKHSRAENAKVSICSDKHDIRIDIEDNGIGFNISEDTSLIKMNKGFGLFSIQERLSHLGGCLEIKSEPGRGTRASLIAPLRYKERNGQENIR